MVKGIKTKFCFIVCILMICAIAYAQDESGQQSKISPYASFQPVSIGDVRWTGGFWKEKLDVCHNTMIPHMWNLFNNPEYSRAYENFKIAAGMMEGRHRGAKFNDGEIYKWMEAASYSYATTKDESLNQLLDEIISVIGNVQRDDGYIHTPVIIEQRKGNVQEGWNDQLHFETYNLGHLMTTACAHHKATGKTSLLGIAVKAAHYLNNLSLEKPAELASVTICPSHYMGIIDLYRVTRNETFLELAKRLIDIRPMTKHGKDHNQDRIPFRRQTQATGHAVRANYLYAGVADIYLETGDQTLLNPLRFIWDDVVYKKMYITGSTGALYDGASPDGSKDHSSIQLIHQAYGRPYQLPNITAYNETCATIGHGLWNWRMLQLSGDSRFADVLELALYNGILSGISLEGKHYFYTNPLRVESDLPFPLRWSRERQPYYGSFCCPPNIVRTIAGIGQYAYGVSGQTIWVNLFGSNKLATTLPNGQSIALKQTTNYPWDGKITFDFEFAPASEVELKIRIPEWADNAVIKINGQAITDTVQSGSYHSIKYSWNNSDQIEVILPLEAILMEAHPLAEEIRNQTAVKRGPIVYCLESVDLPNGKPISDVYIPRDIQFTPEVDSSFPGEITVLKGTVHLKENRNWNQKLYQEFTPDRFENVSTRFIPYYAWGNRGKSEMSVWLPLR